MFTKLINMVNIEVGTPHTITYSQSPTQEPKVCHNLNTQSSMVLIRRLYGLRLYGLRFYCLRTIGWEAQTTQVNLTHFRRSKDSGFEILSPSNQVSGLRVLVGTSLHEILPRKFHLTQAD